jgi:hypothetical protein
VYLARPAGNSPGGAPPSTEVGLEMENHGAPNNFVTLRVFVAPGGGMTSSVTTGSNGSPAGGLQFVGLIDLGPGFFAVYRAYVTTTPTLGLPQFQSIFWPQKTTTSTGWIYAWGAQMVEGTLPQGPVRDPDTPGTEVTIVRPQTCALATNATASRGRAQSRTASGPLVGGAA